MAVAASGQGKNPPHPYDSIAENGVSYAGPGREAAFDLPGPTIRIGLLAPLHGPQKADGDAIVTAARMALEDESRHPLPGGIRLVLSLADESVPPWGPLGDEIIDLVMRDRAIAIITGSDGVSAHLSEQIGNRIGVPVLTISSDPTTTEINLPWIFRLGPSDAVQARAIAQEIYRVRHFERVLLVSDSGHDGRIGGREFLEAAQRLGAPAPISLVVDPQRSDARALLHLLRTKLPRAVVFWTSPQEAGKLIAAVRDAGIPVPIYLSQEAAQPSSGMKFPQPAAIGSGNAASGVYTVVSSGGGSPWRRDFALRYQRATGTFPSAAAMEAYDAVRLIANAVRQAGPNRARVRDVISGMRGEAETLGSMSFDAQGNNEWAVRLVRLR